jgi:hypothetical protein
VFSVIATPTFDSDEQRLITSSDGIHWIAGIYLEQNGKDVTGDIAETVKAQANLATVDYVDDKVSKCPQAYAEYGDEIYYLPETQFDASNGGIEYTNTIEGLYTGSQYVVTINGTPYTCIAESFNFDGIEAIALGDKGLIMGNPDGSFPFFVSIIPASVASAVGLGMIVAVDESLMTTITLAISGREEIVHRLEKKFLPVDNVKLIDAGDSGVISNIPVQELYNMLREGKSFSIDFETSSNILKAVAIEGIVVGDTENYETVYEIKFIRFYQYENSISFNAFIVTCTSNSLTLKAISS